MRIGTIRKKKCKITKRKVKMYYTRDIKSENGANGHKGWLCLHRGDTKMRKTLMNEELDLTVCNWWGRLTVEKQKVLITMLFNMSKEDFKWSDL